MADDGVRIPTPIKKGDDGRARAAFDAMSPDEQSRFWQMVDGGADKFHALNLIHSQRAQDAARGMDINGKGENAPGEASALNSALVDAGNTATGGGVPTIAAALGHGEGDTFAARKKSNVADLAEMEAQNPASAAAGGFAGNAIPALATMGGAAGAGAVSGATGRASLGSIIKQGAKVGAGFGAMQGAMQTDTGAAPSVLGNALLGAGKGALVGGASSGLAGGAVKLMPSLAAPIETGGGARDVMGQLKSVLGRLPGEALENTESALVDGSSAAMRGLAKIAPTVGKYGVGSAAASVAPFAKSAAAIGGAKLGGALGQRAASALNKAQAAPYAGGSVEVPSAADFEAVPSEGGVPIADPGEVPPGTPIGEQLKGAVDRPLPAESSLPVRARVRRGPDWQLNPQATGIPGDVSAWPPAAQNDIARLEEGGTSPGGGRSLYQPEGVGASSGPAVSQDAAENLAARPAPAVEEAPTPSPPMGDVRAQLNAKLDPAQGLALQSREVGVGQRFNAKVEAGKIAGMKPGERQAYFDVLARMHGKSQAAPLAKRFNLTIPSDAPRYSTQPAHVRSASMEGAHTVHQQATGAPWQSSPINEMSGKASNAADDAAFLEQFDSELNEGRLPSGKDMERARVLRMIQQAVGG